MKICFLISAISSSNTGFGGHYESAKTIALGMKKLGHDVLVVSLGDVLPKTLVSLGADFKFIEFTGYSTVAYSIKVTNEISLFSPDSIHSFDNKSYFFARLYSLFNKCNLVLTKPGGSNPNLYFPFCSNITVFSKENESFFLSRKKFNNAKIHYLPNRAVLVSQDEHRIKKLRDIIGSERGVVLRIARFTGAYQESMEQLINLVKIINKDSKLFTGLIIGHPEDEKVVNYIKGISDSDIFLITDEEFTRSASELIDIGDFVLATGRGIYEAALLGKTVFSTVSGSKLPVLLSEKNIETLMAKNFSPRVKKLELMLIDEENEEELKKCLDKKFSSEASEFTKKYAKDKFCIDAVVKTYEKIYSSESSKKYPMDFLLNSVVVLRFYMPVIFSRLKRFFK